MNDSKLVYRENKKVFIMICLYVASVLYVFPVTRFVGYVALIILLVFPVAVVVLRKKVFKDPSLIMAVVVLCVNVGLILRNIAFQSIYYGVLQVLIVTSVLCFSSLIIREENVKHFCLTMKHISNVLIVYNIILFVYSKLLNLRYDTNIYALRNVLYGMILIGLYTKECIDKKFYKSLLVHAVLLFVLTERTMSLGFLTIGFFYWILPKVNTRRKYTFVFFVYVIILLLIPFIYVNLFHSSYAVQLNAFISEYTGKNLFSGRQIIWYEAIEQIKENILWGNGMGSYFFSYTGKQMSVHNVYLYFALQGGIVNLGVILGFFFSVYQKMYKNRNTYYGRLGISILLGIMLLADFGMILFANDILYSVLLWTAVGIGQIKIIPYKYEMSK